MVDLLHPAPTPFEAAIERTSAERWDGFDIDVLRRAQDPWLCPPNLLPWLAYNFGVDLWFDDWDELTKRRMIAAMPRLRRLKGTPAAIRGYLDILGVPVTYAVLPPVGGFLGDYDPDDYRAWLAKLPQLRLYPYLDPVAIDGFFDDDMLVDDEDEATSVGYDAAEDRLVEQAFIWRDGAQIALDLLAWSSRDEGDRRIDSVQVAVPSPALSGDIDGEAYGDLVLHGDTAFTAGVISVDLRPEAIGSDAFDVAPAPFSLRAQTTAYSNVFEETAVLEDERFFDRDLAFDDEGPLLSQDTGRHYVYRRAYLLDPAVKAPAPDGDLCWDDHIWDFTPYQAIIGVDITEPIPDGEDAWCWGDSDGYFAEADTTKIRRVEEAVRCAQGGTDVIIIDTVKFRPLTLGDALRLDGSLKVGQMIERNIA